MPKLYELASSVIDLVADELEISRELVLPNPAQPKRSTHGISQ